MVETVVIHAHQIEMMDVGKLRGYDRNARTHSEEQVWALAKIIQDSGFTNPLLIDDHDIIVAGHGRLLAAMRLEMPSVPCVRVAGLTEAQIKALRLSDNAVGLQSSWDEALLKTELEELEKLGFDTTLTGFTAAELEALFAKQPSAGGDPDTLPPVPENPISRTGDLWRLGDHWLICGDATDPAVVERLLAGKEAQVCVTDPPYGIGYSYKTHDDSDNNANAQLVAKVFALAPAAKVWTPGSNNLARDLTRFGKAKMLIWHKGFAAAGNGLGGASTIEPVLVLNPKRKKLANDYLEFKTDREEVDGKSLREQHPCPKPVALFAHLIEAFVPPKGIVYEPFGGSGTTAISCQATGRVCRVVEIDPSYVDLIIARWCQYTGFEAFHEDGQTFTQVAEARMAESAEQE